MSYDGLERHEVQCGYQSQQCPGCRQQILKKDFAEHKTQCPLIELTCADCKLVYQRRDATARHTEAACLKEQLKQIRHESEENKRQVIGMQEILCKLIARFDSKKSLIDSRLFQFLKRSSLPIYHRLRWNRLLYQ